MYIGEVNVEYISDGDAAVAPIVAEDEQRFFELLGRQQQQ